jgi:NAD(P) transhydrogenase subunit alpha
MFEQIQLGLYVFVLATFIGFEVIRRVPPLLHTPLMSLTNAISGISLVGSLLLAGAGHEGYATVLGAIAVFSSTMNVVGGFVITDRMLRMFRKDRQRPARATESGGEES